MRQAVASLWTLLLAAQEALEFGGEFVTGGKTRGRRQLVIERGLETAHQHPVFLVVGDDLVDLARNASGRGMQRLRIELESRHGGQRIDKCGGSRWVGGSCQVVRHPRPHTDRRYTCGGE